MMSLRFMICTGLLIAGASSALAQPATSDASAPQAVSLSIYDQGFGLVSELRRLTPAQGLNLIRIRSLPARLDPSSMSFVPATGSLTLRVLEQQFLFDGHDATSLLNRYRGRLVDVVAAGTSYQGRLIHVEGFTDTESSGGYIILAEATNARVFLSWADVEQIILPDVGRQAYLEPTVHWRAEAEQEGPQNIRLTYRVDGLRWGASYNVVLNEDGQTAYFAGRVGLENRTGGNFAGAQVQLITTERGLLQEQRRMSGATSSREASAQQGPALRYAYGAREPAFEEQVAGVAPVHTYRLSEAVELNDGDHKFVQLSRVDALPVSRFYVYDGVRFDRYQRHRRNDWNYGTESHPIVETHLSFANEAAEGLGVDLPTGRFRLYQRTVDGGVDFLGDDVLLPTAAGESGHVRLGPARGLRGERERTGYTEITPLRVYEESFQILIENNTSEPVEVRVVEHLYRWHEFEIVRADAEYEETGDQTIEFRPTLRPGGRRTIHYTVRYSW